jgi:hypothetical protein
MIFIFVDVETAARFNPLGPGRLFIHCPLQSYTNTGGTEDERAHLDCEGIDDRHHLAA